VWQDHFTVEEFQARRRKLCDAIGTDAMALLQGARRRKGSRPFRQYNDFYYLCGLETPGAYLLIHGADARATVFLPHESELARDSDEEVLSADNPKAACATTGLDEVLGIEKLGERLARATTVCMPFEDGQGWATSRHDAKSWAHRTTTDPWDTRPTRSAHFIQTVRTRFPQIEVRNLSPVMDELRLIKSPQEIELLRWAGLLTATGMAEAIRSTRSGVMEYQLDAVLRYHYLAGGAGDQAYRAIIAGGANAWHGHYSSNNCALKEGDWVLGDCAPDYHCYTSDIGRMWPVSGAYAPWQRALYGFVVEYHKVLLAGIRPGRMLADIHEEAAETMRSVLDGWKFESAAQEAGARAMFGFRGHLSHCVGMSVHDGGLHYTRPLEPGIVFSVDPQLRVPEERLYVRVEDTVVVTEDGIENLTSQAPLELDDVEALMREDGLLQSFPPG
jgi:Xaa-Pro aminopeptidase